MEHINSDKKFIEDWSVLAGSLGLSHSTSQVFALLLLAEKCMSYEEIMEKLNISRGSTHQSLHKLLDLKLVLKVHQLGERREYFQAETDLWKVLEKMMIHFKRRSLDELIERISESPGDNTSGHLENIKRNLKWILQDYSNKLDYLFKSTQRNGYKLPAGTILKSPVIKRFRKPVFHEGKADNIML